MDKESQLEIIDFLTDFYCTKNKCKTCSMNNGLSCDLTIFKNEISKTIEEE